MYNKSYDVILLTESRYENPLQINDYIQNILREDELLVQALTSYGLRVCRKDWASPNFDWGCTTLALFRTTWNYFFHFDLFKTWLVKTNKQTHLINTYDLVHWNMDKYYLQEVNNKGINIPETYFIKQGEKITLNDIHKNMNWDEIVLKPTISGGGKHTYRMNIDTLHQYESVFQELINQESMMLQPFQNHIVSEGEKSLIFIGSEFTHAVKKVAKKGDFRVQDDFGGSVHHYLPSLEEIEFAKKVINSCPDQPTYARVDIFTDNTEKLALAELELIEPEMWFRFCPAAAEKLAAQVYNIVISKA